MESMNRTLTYLLLPLFICFTGCGSAEPPFESEASSYSGLPPEGGPECAGMNVAACELFKEVNRTRLNHGLSVLKPLPSCVAASQSHATAMAETQLFSHDGQNETWEERMDRFGLSDAAVGENIAFNTKVAETVVAWMNSPGHRRNLLSMDYNSTGVGFHSGYWVQCYSGKNP